MDKRLLLLVYIFCITLPLSVSRALIPCDAASLINQPGVPYASCTGEGVGGCSSGYSCCPIAGNWNGDKYSVITKAVCARVSSQYDVDNHTGDTWKTMGFSYQGTLVNDGLGQNCWFLVGACDTSAENTGNYQCEGGEFPLIEDCTDDVAFCAASADECCAKDEEACNMGALQAHGGPNVPPGTDCCSNLPERQVCFQRSNAYSGVCRNCALKPDGSKLPFNQENAIDDDCASSNRCCYFDGSPPLVCDDATKKCAKNLTIPSYCDKGGVSKIPQGIECGFPGVPTSSVRNECENCPGGESHTVTKSSTTYGQDMLFCTGLNQGEGTCGGSCHCNPAAPNCTSEQKCEIAGSCITSGNCSAADCCNGYHCDDTTNHCVSDEPPAGSCSASCDPEHSTCSSSCPCVGSPGTCNSGAGPGGGGAVPCNGTGCGGDCGGGRSCDGGYCSEPGVCTPKPVDFLKFGYSGPEISNLSGLLAAIFNILYAIGLAIGIFMIVKSGYALMTSQGEPNAVRTAQEDLTSAVLGILFILLSITILRVIINSLLGSTVGF